MKLSALITLIASIAFLGGCSSDFNKNPTLWLASGQSNMQWEADFSSEDNPHILGFKKLTNGTACSVPSGIFETLDVISCFSEVAANFAIEMNSLTNSEVKIITAAWGGTAISCWRRGAICYETAIRPFLDQKLNGVLWWQGESDAFQRSQTYGEDLLAMIAEWREDFGNPSLPFYVVELETYEPCVDILSDDAAGFSKDLPCGEPEWWTSVREQQLRALELENVFIVPSADITNGEVHAIYAHSPVGKRLAGTAFEHEEHLSE